MESVEEEGKTTKIWISQEQEELLRWNKESFFIVLEGLSLDEKNDKK